MVEYIERSKTKRKLLRLRFSGKNLDGHELSYNDGVEAAVRIIEDVLAADGIQELTSENAQLKEELAVTKQLLKDALSHIHLVALEAKTSNPCFCCVKNGENCKVCAGFVYVNTDKIANALSRK